MSEILTAVLAVYLFLTCGALAESAVAVTAGGLSALVSTDGREIIPPGVYDAIFTVTDGERFAVGTQTDDGMRYALCDEEGRLLTESAYSMFHEAGGVILCRRDGLYGAVSTGGDEVLPAEYTLLTTGDGENFLAMKRNPYDDDPDEIIPVAPGRKASSEPVSTDEGLFRIVDDRMPFQDPDTEYYGYLDGQGRIAIRAAFDTAGLFQNGIARVSADGKYGLIRPDGTWIVWPEYGFLETDGSIAVGTIDGEHFVVLDVKTGEERFRLEGEYIYAALVNGYPVWLSGDALRIFSPDGAVLLETGRETSVLPGAGGQLILSDGEWGTRCVSLMNADGTLLPEKYQQLIPLAPDRYSFGEMKAVGYYSDLLGEVRVSCDYDSQRFGLMDGSGKIILPAEYSEILYLGQNCFAAVGEKRTEMIDRDGNVLWSAENFEE